MDENKTRSELPKALLLFAATCASTLYVGCAWSGVDLSREGFASLWKGWPFAVPLMAILLAHEFGHYIAARVHHIDASLPYFLPMPISQLGTLGAVIHMRGAIRTRNALLDVGASGPLCGLVVALPVLVYGIAVSPVTPLDPAQHYWVEGRSLLYLGILHVLKGDIPQGHDVMLSAPAVAGWAGLLVTMVNLVPVGQLDGGHVAYALFGPRQDVFSRRIRRFLPVLALLITVWAVLRAEHENLSANARDGAWFAGMFWLLWWGLLGLMTRLTGPNHPPTEDHELGRGRRMLAWFTLALFILLFMPTWMSET
jgi:membrane-associated protease RseP (regulator of RpoE activity)